MVSYKSFCSDGKKSEFRTTAMVKRPFLRRQWPPLALLLHLAIIVTSHAIYLDIHVPVPNIDDCLMTQTLRANELLRSFSRIPNVNNSTHNDDPQPREQVDLFSRHTPHITLFLADFDLELDGNHTRTLNVTKVDSFLEKISTINFTNVIQGLECTLSLIDHNDDIFYRINGSFTMLNIQNNPCLKTLSSAILWVLEPFVKKPIIVPNWVASLPEPKRSAAIYRCRKYGSPNVLEGFVPHLTVGFDPPTTTSTVDVSHHSLHTDIMKSNAKQTRSSMQWREDAMKQWNEGFVSLVKKDGCRSNVKGIAVGRNSIGGTVLANSRMRYWSIVEEDDPYLT